MWLEIGKAVLGSNGLGTLRGELTAVGAKRSLSEGRVQDVAAVAGPQRFGKGRWNSLGATGLICVES